MSLLMEALRKAEEAKRRSQEQQSEAAGATPVDELHEPAPPVRHRSLFSLEPREPAAAPGVDPEPAAAPMHAVAAEAVVIEPPRDEVQDYLAADPVPEDNSPPPRSNRRPGRQTRDQLAAASVFAAKQAARKDPRKQTRLMALLGLGLTVSLGGGATLWYLQNQSSSGLAINPAIANYDVASRGFLDEPGAAAAAAEPGASAAPAVQSPAADTSTTAAASVAESSATATTADTDQTATTASSAAATPTDETEAASTVLADTATVTAAEGAAAEGAAEADAAAQAPATAELSPAAAAELAAAAVASTQARNPAAAPAAAATATSAPASADSAAQTDNAAALVTAVPAAAPAATTAATDTGAAPATTSAAPTVRTLEISRSSGRSSVNSTLQSAYNTFQSGDLQAAALLYQEVLAELPNNRDAMIGLAAIRLRAGDFAAARQLYAQLLTLNPQDPYARTGLLQATQAGNDPAHETELKTLLQRHPDLAPLHFALGNLHAAQQRWSEAQADYFNALLYAGRDSSTPVSPDYAFNLAVSLEQLQQPQAALDYYRQAQELSRASPPGFDPALLASRLAFLEQTLP